MINIKCPVCDYEVPEGNPWVEIAHMELNHPEVIAQRLRDAGLEPADHQEKPHDST